MVPDPSPRPAPTTLDQEFAPFGDRVESFVRSLLILAEYRGDLASPAAEPNLRIVRSAFGKWAVELLVLLGERRRATFGSLRAELPKVSARVLSRKLQALEAAGLVQRLVVPSRPPRPEYFLTERGTTLFRASGRILAFVRAASVAARAREQEAPGPSRDQAPADDDDPTDA